MQGYENRNRWWPARNKRSHWAILTLDDLDKTNGKNRRLIAQLQARYLAAKVLGVDQHQQKSEDFSI